MTRTLPHNRLIAQAAEELLAPLGVRRKGRSRVWLDDHGWWLGVVEFQPSSWDRGTYLNVGAMWLWCPHRTDVYFDLSHRANDLGLMSYESDEQFRAAAREVATRAAAELTDLRQRIHTFEDVARAVDDRARGVGGWAAWDAAIALGLAGKRRAAAKMFERTAATDDDRDWWLPIGADAQRLAGLVKGDPDGFRSEINEWIARYRELLKLDQLPEPV